MSSSFTRLVVKSAGVLALEQAPIPALSHGEILIKASSPPPPRGIVRNDHLLTLCFLRRREQLRSTPPLVLRYQPSTTPRNIANELAYHQDWKHLYFVSPPGAGLGCDFSGTIESIGEGVSKVAVGDRVAGFVHGGQWPGVGSFAEYVKTEAALVWKVPNSTSWAEAAAMGGIGPQTAVQALYFRHGLPQPTKPLKTSEPFLVWGGATSVGLYAVQLAKLSGYEVIATASPKNFELLKSLGVDAVYSYSDPQTPELISAAYPTLSLALDTISEPATSQATSKSLGKEGSTKRKIIKLLPVQDGDNAGLDVDLETTLVYTVLGKEFTMRIIFPVNAKDKADITAWLEYFPKLVESGRFRSNPIWEQEGGLVKVHEGLELLKAGKNSAQKVVYTL
ncbi:hypothetical protein P7C70_g1422, partial [Phenoliferia sp. Uapishka_3]